MRNLFEILMFATLVLSAFCVVMFHIATLKGGMYMLRNGDVSEDLAKKQWRWFKLFLCAIALFFIQGAVFLMFMV